MVSLTGSILDDTFDSRDVDWVKEDDRLLRAVLNSARAGQLILHLTSYCTSTCLGFRVDKR